MVGFKMILYKENRLYRELISNDVRPDIRTLAVAIMSYLEALGVDMVITSVLDEAGVKRKSSTHKDGRAFDIRVKDWPIDLARSLTQWLNKMFSTGVFFESGEPMQVAVLHNSGYGDHIHVQVSKRPLIINTESGGVLL